MHVDNNDKVDWLWTIPVVAHQNRRYTELNVGSWKISDRDVTSIMGKCSALGIAACALH